MKYCPKCDKETERTKRGDCKDCHRKLQAKYRLPKNQWSIIPADTLIRCYGAGFGIHYVTKTLMGQIYIPIKDNEYYGACMWCKIISASRNYAKKHGFTPLQLPLKEVPWIFFPKALQAQNNTCFIPWCTVKQNGIQLNADHDHITGQFRGFICGHHNSNFMNGIDEAEEHGITINLPFAYPGDEYYPTTTATTFVTKSIPPYYPKISKKIIATS